MPIIDEHHNYPLNIQKPELIEMFRKKTKVAILVLSISFFGGIVLFILLYLCKAKYYFLPLSLPLFGYVWLITLGAKNVNNHYGFRRKSDETIIYLKNPKYGYFTYATVFVVIFLISSLVRLFYEIRNYDLIRQTISSHKSSGNG